MSRPKNSERVLFKIAMVGVAVGVLGFLMRDSRAGTPPTLYAPWFIGGGGGLVLLTTVAAIRQRLLLRAFLVSAGVLAFGVWLATPDVPARTPGKEEWSSLVAIGGTAVLTTVVPLWQQRGGSAGLVNRWSRRGRRNDGVASPWAILRTSSGWAMRRKMAVLRPSFRQLSWFQRMTVSLHEFATSTARVGIFRIWSPIEDVTLRIGGPRSGKTGELAGRILDAPGAVIATSTRTDLIDLTAAARQRTGPLYVFNPCGLADLDSTITFDPLSGCSNPTTATSRAADLLAAVSAPGRDGGDREFWTGQARRVLSALMHAAALGGLSMRDVLAWVADPDHGAAEVTRLLRRSPEPAYEQDAAQFLATNDRTRSSICATIMPALGWLTDSTAAAAASGGDFDVDRLLAERGTVYMLGAEEAHVAPLVTALTGHIAREARRQAAHCPSGRLDPPLTLALDEAALICLVPLNEWTADMGGRGVTIHIAAQSRAQLRERWGDAAAATIINNAATLLVFGGTRDPEDLNAYSTLTGERDEKVDTYDEYGNRATRTTRRVPVLSPGQIAQLPFRHVVVIRRGMPPAIGKVQMAWARRDLKTIKRRARWAHRVEAWVAVRQRLHAQIARSFSETHTQLAPLLARVSDRRPTRRNSSARGDTGQEWSR
jgi:type IV secretion system protein VirD4